MTRPIIIPADSYPLSWPLGAPRTKSPRRSVFRHTTFSKSVREVRDELTKLGAKTILISSNLAGDTVRNGDHGCVAYWTVREKVGDAEVMVPHQLACDVWNRLDHNLHAIALSLESLRGLDRWGAIRRDQAFAGLRALPAGESGVVVARPWREVLGGFPDGLDREDLLALAKSRHRKLIAAAHPDRGGNQDDAIEINAAIAAAEAELTSGP